MNRNNHLAIECIKDKQFRNNKAMTAHAKTAHIKTQYYIMTNEKS